MNAKIGELKIDYQDDGAGVPVLFVHAFPLNQRMWDPQRRELLHQCRIITLDLPGFGGSDAPPAGYSIDQMADVVRGLMGELGIDRAVLVGLSMGGYVSMAFCRKYHEAAAALVLANTRATADTPEARERRFKSAEKAEREGPASIADDMVSLLFAPSTLNERPQIVQEMRAMAALNSAAGLATAQRAMAGRLDSTDVLASVEVPALIIAGSEDRLSSLAEAELMHNKIKGSRLEVIKAAGHLTNMEQPATFNHAISELIRSIRE